MNDTLPMQYGKSNRYITQGINYSPNAYTK